MNKKTLVIGGSTNPDRYSYKAINMLRQHGHETVSVGLKEGEVAGVKIQKDLIPFTDIDTISLYVGPANQTSYYDYLISIKPKRVIFNPGTENPELYEILKKENIESVEACTLVMLTVGNF